MVIVTLSRKLRRECEITTIIRHIVSTTKSGLKESEKRDKKGIPRKNPKKKQKKKEFTGGGGLLKLRSLYNVQTNT